MKFATIATLSIFHMGAAFAGEPGQNEFPHEYENGGHFAGQVAVVETAQTEEAFKHKYENGGHFEGAAPESGDQQAK